MSEVLLRQWAMLQRIPRYPRKITAPELKAALEEAGYVTTVRTIQRDLKTLSGVFPLRSDERTPPFGWSWDKNADLMDIPGMDGRTALTFKLVETYSRKLLPPTVIDFLGPYFRQADTVLATLGTGPLGAWAERIRVIPRGLGLLTPTVKPEVLAVVYEALFEQKRFRALYLPRTDGAPDPREYAVNPHGLVFRDQLVYLVATLWDYDDIKQLALHRFEAAELLEEPLRVPEGFSFGQYVAAGAFDYPEGDEIQLEALFTQDAAFHLHETPLSPDQTIEPHDADRVRVTATVQDSAQLLWWLLAFGDQVTVLEPSGLRSTIAQIAAQMLSAYLPSSSGALSPDAGAPV